MRPFACLSLKWLHLSQDRRVEEVRRLQVRLEEQEERNKTLREVNSELRRQLQRHEYATGGANEKPILTRVDAGTGKKVSEALKPVRTFEED